MMSPLFESRIALESNPVIKEGRSLVSLVRSRSWVTHQGVASQRMASRRLVITFDACARRSRSQTGSHYAVRTANRVGLMSFRFDQHR